MELFNSQEALGKLIILDMEVKKAYFLRKFIIESGDKLKPFLETRTGLIKKYWEELDNWNTQVKKENENKFHEEINKIWEEEIKIEIPEITIDDIDWKIDTQTLLQLTYLIK